MVNFFYGPDDYRREAQRREFMAQFRENHSGLAVGIFDGEVEGALDAFSEFVRSQSIFESAKLAVLTGAFSLDAAKLEKAIAPALASKTTTVLIDEREKPLKAFAFLLKPPVIAEHFEALKGAEWTAFVKREAKQRGLTLADAAAQFLGAVYDGNAWALVMELEKLAALKGGAATVSRQDLDALDLEAAPDYWMLLNGLKSQDGRTRLATLEKLFSLNDPPPKIFNILAAQAGDRTARMAEYDAAIKSGKLEYEEALLDLVLG